MKPTTLDVLRACVLGPDAAFHADVTDCLDYLFNPDKLLSKNPKNQRIMVESLIEQAVEYGRSTRDRSKAE